MRLVRGALATCVVLLAANIVAAQGSGGLSVQVIDSNGDPLPGATVTLSHNAGNVKPYTLISDKKGWARFPVLRPGPGYIIEVKFMGFGTRRESDVRVPIGEQKTLPIQMVEEMTERVKVVATTDVVELESTSHSTKFSDEFVQDLPVPGRFYQNVLTLAPGVQDPDGDGNPTVHGSRSRDFRAEVSGVSNVDPLTGQFMSLVNSDSIEEMEVITGGAGVEFGRAQGGFARIIQKQGTNEFEGTFGLLYRSSKLDGTGAADFNNIEDPEFQSSQPSLQLSGPIVKDKFWYRLSHEQINQEDPVNVVSGVAVQTTNQGIHADQLTWQVSPRNKLAFQWQSDPLEIDNLGISSVVPSESTLSINTESQTFSTTWTAPYSPKLLVESTIAWQDLNRQLFPTQRGVTNDCVQGDAFLEDARCTNFQTGTTSGSHFLDVDAHSQRLTVRSQATLYGGRIAGANNQFKFGFIAENERYEQYLEQRPNVAFFQLNTFDDPEGGSSPEVQLVLAATVSVPETSDVRATGTNWSVYFEDQITPINNLVMTVGLRVDREEITSNGMIPFDPAAETEQFFTALDSGQSANFIFANTFTAYEGTNDFVAQVSSATGVDPDDLLGQLANVTRQSSFWNKERKPGNITTTATNPAPRFGISWDPWSNGKTKFALSAGRYYDKLFLNIPLLELNPATTQVVFNMTETGHVEGLRNNVNPAVNIDAVSRDLNTPYQDEFRLLFERELFTETLLRVEYIKRDYRDQLQNIDINHLPGDFGKCKLATYSDPTPIVVSPGEGQEITDTFTGEVYIDTDPGDGDGRVDDCVGKIEAPINPAGGEAGGGAARIEVPDGVADLYTQNPGWGQINLVGNFNYANYEGIILEMIRRQYRSWEMQASYTYSTSEGNGEDFNQFLGLDASLLDDEFGWQSSDQRHVVKASATTITPWGFRLGGSVSWQSGLPYSLLTQRFSFDTVPQAYGSLGSYSPSRIRIQYPTGQRNDQRNTSYWLVDLKLTKELNLGRGVNMQLSAEVFNVLNEGVYQVYNPDLETGFQINGVNNARRLFGRQWQLGFKLAF